LSGKCKEGAGRKEDGGKNLRKRLALPDLEG
jgi:hypothetical protein